MERDLDVCNHENLKLRGLSFELDLKIADYTAMIDQTSKRIKLLQERSSRVLRDLETSNAAQEKDYKRYTAELDIAKRDLEKLRKDREHILEDLRRIEGENNKTKRE